MGVLFDSDDTAAESKRKVAHLLKPDWEHYY
jgi:hypothetical protein